MESRPIAANSGTALEVVRPTNIVSADDWTDERKEFIRKNFCGGAPDDIAALFLELCRRRRLSPEARQIYLVNRAAKDKTPNFVIQMGIDGYRLVADRTGRYAGSSDATFVHDPDGHLAIATVTVGKIVGGIIGSFTASARWDEYQAGSPLWHKMPHTMLAKCAEALALRKAFPEELSGIYTDAEMDQAENAYVETGTPRAAVREASPAQPKAVAAGDNTGAMKAVHAAAKDKGIAHEQLSALAVAVFGVPSMTDCEARQLTDVRYAVRDCTAEEFGALVNLAQVVDVENERARLDEIAGEIERSDLPPIATKLLKATIKRVGEGLQV